jgi:dipeptidyl aminopeptidase/acylaminoacyl peptidase
MSTRDHSLFVLCAAVALMSAVMVVIDAQPSQAAFPGENGQIVFTRYDDSGGPMGKDIWAANPDGTGLHPVTSTPQVYEHWPTWSPDGSQIAFVAPHSDSGSEVWVMSYDGSNPRHVSNLPGSWGRDMPLGLRTGPSSSLRWSIGEPPRPTCSS